jgi:hypothetical protein
MPPKVSGDKRKNQNAEQVEPARHPGARSADREDECANEIEHKQ